MTQAMYIELDALLDTRLATLIRLSDQLAKQAIDNGYRNRDSDRWDRLGLDVDQPRYDELYRQRDKQTLKLARPTNLLVAIERTLEDLKLQAMVGPGEEKTTLFINLYPYHFDSEREIEAIKMALRYHLGASQPIETGFYAPEQLTPGLINNNWQSVFSYDFNEWLVAQVENLKAQRLTRTTFVSPALYWNDPPETDDDTYIEEFEANVSPFGALELSLTEWLALHLLDPVVFSVVVLDTT